jgi:Secretion system C-terminal sorting domain
MGKEIYKRIILYRLCARSVPQLLRRRGDTAGKKNAYPNAVSDKQHLEISFDKPGEELVINLYDVSGRQIMSIFNGVAGQTHIKLTVNLSAIQSGTYFYSFNYAGLKRKDLKIVKI